MIGHSVRSEVEWLLLRRARDGELSRVGGVYLHRGRDYATEPIEELVMAGLLADPDPVGGWRQTRFWTKQHYGERKAQVSGPLIDCSV